VGAHDDFCWGVAIQPDGKIVAAGSVWNGSHQDIALVRYHANGALDASFDGDGKAVTNLSTDATGLCVALQPNGKIVVGGQSLNVDTRGNTTLLRYHSNGALDTSFGDAGMVITPISNFHDQASALAIQVDGKIVVAGYSLIVGGTGLVLARYNADGALDASFQTLGSAGTPIPAITTDIALQPDGKIVVVGVNAGDFFVGRFAAYGDPVALPDAVSASEDASVLIDVLGNDQKAPGNDFGLLLATAGTAKHGTVAVEGAFLRYTPAPHFHGTDSFSYTLDQQQGGQAIGFVTVTVHSVNDAPTAVGNSAFANEDSFIDINVLANDSSSPDTGETLTIRTFTQPAHGAVTQVGNHLRYTPAGNFNGADSFLYALSDGNGGTDMALVNVTVNAVNDDPTANLDAAVVDEDAQALIDVLANDSSGPEAGEILAVQSFTQGAHGAVAMAGGRLRYTPHANFFGADSFTYTVSDGNGGSDSAIVNVTINPVNDAPVNFVPTAQKTKVNKALIFSATRALAIADSDAGGGQVSVTLIVTNGTLTLGSVAGLTSVTGNGKSTVKLTGTVASINAALNGLRFKPKTGFRGKAKLTMLTDDLGNTGLGGAKTAASFVGITVA
jgi:uncharacterized delta-60 repeat protein